MSTTQEQLINISTKAIRDFVRTGTLPQWAPEDYWWFGFIHAWGMVWRDLSKEHPLTVAAFERALKDLELDDSEIHGRGAHKYLELDNITFVYRDRHYKNGSSLLKIAPQIKGKKFSECAHPFIFPYGFALDLALYLLEIDRTIPALKEACLQAYYDGLCERRVREIKHKIAEERIREYFGGTMPECIISIIIRDSTPGAADRVHVVINGRGAPIWKTLVIDIPYDDLDKLSLKKHIFVEQASQQAHD